MTLAGLLRRVGRALPALRPGALVEGAHRFVPGRGPTGPQRFVLRLRAAPLPIARLLAPRDLGSLRAAVEGTLRADGLCAETDAAGRAYLRLSRHPSLRLVVAFRAAGRPHLLRLTGRWPGLRTLVRVGLPVRGTVRRETDGAPIATVEAALRL